MKYKILDYVKKLNRLKKRLRKEKHIHDLDRLWNNKFFDGEIKDIMNWCPVDTLEEYEKNIKNNIKLEYGVNDIKYELNEYGYRTSEKTNKKILKKGDQNIIACFGCSHTFGAGLPWEHVWTSVLNEKLGENWIVKNYGINGASNDTISRIIYNYLNTETPKAICCLFPESIRMEVYDKNGLRFYSPSFINDIQTYHSYMNLMTEEYADYLFVKNFNFISAMCQANNVKFYWSTWCESILKWDADKIKNILNLDNYVSVEYLENELRARDNAHPGRLVNKRLGDGFYEKIIKDGG